MTDRPAADPLSDLLRAHRVRAEVIATPAVCGPWQIGTWGAGRPVFHLVVDGGGWLHTDRSSEPEPLAAGDLLVVPRDAFHMVTPDGVLRSREEVFAQEPTGAAARFVCGTLDFVDGGADPLLRGLPDIVVVRRADAGADLTRAAQWLVEEASRDAPGRGALLDALANSLFCIALRHVLAASDSPGGLLGALRDARLNAALMLIHARPAQPPSLVELARAAGMSRTAFVERFTATIGQPPAQYAQAFRLSLAARRLRNNRRASVQAIAESVGYATEAAFRRAFARYFGYGPGRLRRDDA